MEEAGRGTPTLPPGEGLDALVAWRRRTFNQPNPNEICQLACERIRAAIGKTACERAGWTPAIEAIQDLAGARRRSDPDAMGVVLEYKLPAQPVAHQVRRSPVPFAHAGVRSTRDSPGRRNTS